MLQCWDTGRKADHHRHAQSSWPVCGSTGMLCSDRHHIRDTRDLAIKCNRAGGIVVSIQLKKEICKTEELDPNHVLWCLSPVNSEACYARLSTDFQVSPWLFLNADLKKQTRHEDPPRNMSIRRGVIIHDSCKFGTECWASEICANTLVHTTITCRNCKPQISEPACLQSVIYKVQRRARDVTSQTST